MKHDLVLLTVYFSVFMQFLTSAIQLQGIFIKMPEEHAILTDILKMETIVQVIEASFYVWLIFNFKNIKKMASKRYYDWVITTPLMLLATIIYMKYLETRENVSGHSIIKIKDFLWENSGNISKITVSNFVMLVFGYLGEVDTMNIVTSVILGSVFFLYTFYVIWDQYAKYSVAGKLLFYFLFVVWALYAVAALMTPKYKNISYNILDIISKNFYGLYIYYAIKKIAGH